MLELCLSSLQLPVSSPSTTVSEVSCSLLSLAHGWHWQWVQSQLSPSCLPVQYSLHHLYFELESQQLCPSLLSAEEKDAFLKLSAVQDYKDSSTSVPKKMTSFPSHRQYIAKLSKPHTGAAACITHHMLPQALPSWTLPLYESKAIFQNIFRQKVKHSMLMSFSLPLSLPECLCCRTH